MSNLLQDMVGSGDGEKKEEKKNRETYQEVTTLITIKKLSEPQTGDVVRGCEIQPNFTVEETESPGARKRKELGTTSNVFSLSTECTNRDEETGKGADLKRKAGVPLGHINSKYSLYIQIEILSSQMEVRQRSMICC